MVIAGGSTIFLLVAAFIFADFLAEYEKLSEEAVDRIIIQIGSLQIYGFMVVCICSGHYALLVAPLNDWVHDEMWNQVFQLGGSKQEHHSFSPSLQIRSMNWRHTAAVRSMHLQRFANRRKFNRLLRWRFGALPVAALYISGFFAWVTLFVFYIVVFLDVGSPFRFDPGQMGGYIFPIFLGTIVQGWMAWRVVNLVEFVIRSRALLWSYKKVSKRR